MTDQAQAQAPQQEDPLNAVEITLKLPVAAVNQVLFALAKMPYEHSAGTITAIRQQGDPQVNAARVALAQTSPANANRKTRRAAAKKAH